MLKGHVVAFLMQTISIISPSWHVLLNAHMMSSTFFFFSGIEMLMVITKFPCEKIGTNHWLV